MSISYHADGSPVVISQPPTTLFDAAEARRQYPHVYKSDRHLLTRREHRRLFFAEYWYGQKVVYLFVTKEDQEWFVNRRAHLHHYPRVQGTIYIKSWPK